MSKPQDIKDKVFEKKKKGLLKNLSSIKNKDLLVVMADPDTDIVFIRHKGFTAPLRAVNSKGERMSIVQHALKYEKDENAINQFLLMIDGGLASISNAVYNMANKKQDIKNVVKKMMKK